MCRSYSPVNVDKLDGLNIIINIGRPIEGVHHLGVVKQLPDLVDLSCSRGNDHQGALDGATLKPSKYTDHRIIGAANVCDGVLKFRRRRNNDPGRGNGSEPPLRLRLDGVGSKATFLAPLDRALYHLVVGATRLFELQ